MTTPEPAVQAVGAMLRTARLRRMMLPEQPAEYLGVPTQTVRDIEDGHRCVGVAELTALTSLYRCGQDRQPLWGLLIHAAAQARPARDDEPGHARRLDACIRQARCVRWLSTALLPAPLQTPGYARAVDEHSTYGGGAPVPPAACAVYVLDVRVIRRGSGTPRLMAEQVEHLLRLTERGTDIRIVGEDHPLPQPPGHLVEMELPAGRIVARPGGPGVDYHRGDTLAAHIDAALDVTDSYSSYGALEQAAAFHRALVETGPVQLSWQTSTEGTIADVH
ncbi:Scr1 family TA system antitoxin-like transcriptional regulator [Streptomyces sp. NBC_00439]|uniref:Scr1 family TA system antitoxin-like transcriptional regulator n=1 Tax=unclassified Streptomyces TaxID=2593676 RepID=UPI00224E87F6|nr:Scr1 family TA system antitoxin-like transcriptional regulator [Streptomyces sp. NBC_00439]MCX5103614.1 Scr1 family TA system antitoxin-like transcriptional regulator [Streptomyces sp. NBC_00439]WSX06237.1 Scr1 family TA system antitoxin-like transcriptional regulator [Streptomyces sp. NBC_00987]